MNCLDPIILKVAGIALVLFLLSFRALEHIRSSFNTTRQIFENRRWKLLQKLDECTEFIDLLPIRKSIDELSDWVYERKDSKRRLLREVRKINKAYYKKFNYLKNRSRKMAFPSA